MTFKLRPYQQDCLSNLAKDFEEHKSLLIVMATGTGKTITFLEWLNRQQLGRGLIIAHRQELIFQPRDKMVQFFPDLYLRSGIVMAGQNDADADIICATVQTLNANGRLDKILAHGLITHVVVDEAHHCHIPGTLVVGMSFKPAPIEEIVTGQKVLSFADDGMQFNRVDNTFKYWYDGAVHEITTESGTSVTVTPNHKMYTSEGKKNARDIKKGDVLFSLSHVRVGDDKEASYSSASQMETSRIQALFGVLGNCATRAIKRTQSRPQDGIGDVSVLRQGNEKKGPRGAHQRQASRELDARSRQTQGGNGKAFAKSRIPTLFVRENETQQPNERPGSKVENDTNYTANGNRWKVATLRAREIWQRWRTNTSRATLDSLISWGAFSIRHSPQGWGAALSLQGRFCVARFGDMFRSRWYVSRQTRAQASRCAQRQKIEQGGLDGRSDKKRRSFHMGDTVHAVAIQHYTGYVYDIEVANSHNYFANNLLSSNSVAATYRSVLDRLREANPDLLELGVTATPKRTDRDGLAQVYERCSYNLPIKSAIRKEALVPFDALGIGVPVSLAGIKETSEGWEREPLGDVLSAENVLQIVYGKWAELCHDKQTIGFTSSVAQAHATAAYFRARGIEAEAADGTTHKKERAAILRRYQSGETQVIFNCQLYTEGFDAPETGAVMMIAPTKSSLVYVQRLGRGLRIAPGKKTCRVLDFAPLKGRKIITAGDVLGKPLKLKKAEERAEAAGVLTSINVDMLGRAVTIDPDSLIIEVLNLMSGSPLPWALDGIYATTALTKDSAAALVLPDPVRLETAETMRHGDNWSDGAERLYQYLKKVRLYRVTKDHRAWSADLIGTFEHLDDAKDEVSDWQGDHLGNRRSPWRKKEASSKQINFLMRLVSDVPESVTSGEASRMISQALTVKAIQAAEKRQELSMVNTK